MSFGAVQKLSAAGSKPQVGSAAWKEIAGTISLMWYSLDQGCSAVLTTIEKEDFENLPEITHMQFAWVTWDVIREDARRYLDEQMCSALERQSGWLCVPKPVRSLTFTLFLNLVSTGKLTRFEHHVQRAGVHEIDDIHRFADNLKEVQPGGKKRKPDEKPDHSLEAKASQHFPGKPEHTRSLEDAGTSFYTAAELTEATRRVRDELMDVEVEDETGTPRFRVNIISATPLENILVMYAEINVDVRWQDASAFFLKFAEIGITFTKLPRAYRSIPGGTERRHYQQLKEHMEDAASKCDWKLHVTIIAERNADTIITTALRTGKYATLLCGCGDFVLTSRPFANTRDALRNGMAIREVKTEESAKKLNQLAAQMGGLYGGYVASALCPLFLSGGDPGQKQLAMLATRRRDNGAYTLNVYKDIPPSVVMEAEAQWVQLGQKFADGDTNAFPGDVVAAYEYLKSKAVFNVSRKALCKAYAQAKALLPPAVLDSEQGADAVLEELPLLRY